MSKIIKILLAVMLLMTASACSKGSSKPAEKKESAPEPEPARFRRLSHHAFNAYR